MTRIAVLLAWFALASGCVYCESKKWHKEVVHVPASSMLMNYGTPDSPVFMSIDTPAHDEVRDVCDPIPKKEAP